MRDHDSRRASAEQQGSIQHCTHLSVIRAPPPTRRTFLYTTPIRAWADMEVAHPSSNPQRPPARPHTRLQAAEKLVSPGSILFSHRSKPATLGPTHVRTVSQDMDKRHPSSFQQLEKVPRTLLVLPPPPPSLFNPADLASSEKEPMLRYFQCNSPPPHPHPTDKPGLQRPKPAEWRAGGTQRNTSRFGGRNTVDSHPRNLLDERAAA